MSFNRFAGSATDGARHMGEMVVCDGYRVVERGEPVINLWCRDCTVGRCTCPLICTRWARRLTRKHRARTVVEGFIGQAWEPLKRFDPVALEVARG